MTEDRGRFGRTNMRCQSEKMLRVVTLCLMFLEWTWITRGAPVLQDSLMTTQEHFNLEQVSLN